MFIEKRAFDIEQLLLSEFNARYIGRSSDISGSLYRYLTGTSNVSGLDVICRIRYGTVIESFPFLNCYRVSLEGGSHVMCSYLGGPSSLPFGAKEASLLMPGSGVYVIEHPRSQIHTIIGVEPPARIAIGSYFSDRLVPGSHIGFDKEASNILYFSTSSNALIDYSIGRPPDMAGGEWAVVSELGGTLFLDSFMGMFKFDEETGLWIFYHDQMVRLSGHNLQIRSAVSEREDYHDETEHNLIENYYFFPWEAIGKFRPSSTSFPFLQLSRADIQTSLQDRYLVEPISDRQTGFNRYFEMKGFLPGGAARYMTIPSPWFMSPSVVNEMRSRDEVRVIPQQLGVWMEKVHLNGAYIMASAKSIVLYKAGSPFPVPIRTSNPESIFGRRPSSRHVLPGMLQPGPDWTGHIGEVPYPNYSKDKSLLSSDYFSFVWGCTVHSSYINNFDLYSPHIGHPIAFLRLIRAMMYYGHVPPDIAITGGSGERVDIGLASLALSMTDDWYLPTYSYIRFLLFGTDEDSNCSCYGKPPERITLEIYSGKYADYYRMDAYIAITDDGTIILRAGDGSIVIVGYQGTVQVSARHGVSISGGHYVYITSLAVYLNGYSGRIAFSGELLFDSLFLTFAARVYTVYSFYTYIFNICEININSCVALYISSHSFYLNNSVVKWDVGRGDIYAHCFRIVTYNYILPNSFITHHRLGSFDCSLYQLQDCRSLGYHSSYPETIWMPIVSAYAIYGDWALIRLSHRCNLLNANMIIGFCTGVSFGYSGINPDYWGCAHHRYPRVYSTVAYYVSDFMSGPYDCWKSSDVDIPWLNVP
ncbi:MAG: hypothetical protein QXT45_05955 [Candidatus Bilamarchaeaceae archaeon]